MRGHSIEQMVPVIALVSLVAKFLNQPSHVRHAHPISGSGLGHHVFLNHDAAQVIGSKLQRHLADFRALCHPRALDAGKIIEVNPAQGLGAKVIVRAYRRRFELRMLRLKGPGNESREALALVLLRAAAFQMFHAVLDSFDVAKHHGRGRT